MPPRPASDAALRAALAVAREQAGMITRTQALECGMTAHAIRWRLDRGDWTNVHGTTSTGGRRSVYATFSGRLDATARLWAAILVCGRDATLSHDSAAELHGLIDPRGPKALIHVTVPSGRNLQPPDGVRLHYSGRLDMSRHPALEPPRTRIDDTVIDLTQTAKNLDRAAALITDAVQRRLTTHDRIVVNINGRRKLGWRAELLEMCGVVGEGAQSLIEFRYASRVEQAHGLPAADRQVRLKGPSQNGLLAPGEAALRVVDNRYTGRRLVVELDGQRGHTGDGVFRDMWRDNVALIQGDRTLRFGLGDVTERPCETAAIVAVVLDVQTTPCGASCDVVRFAEKLRAT